MKPVGAALLVSGFASLVVMGLILKLIEPDVRTWSGYLFATPPGLIVAGLLLLWIDDLLERHTARALIQRLLAASARPREPWRLPAPESYMLLRGGRCTPSDVFRLGFLHLVAAGVLRLYPAPVGGKPVSVGFDTEAARRAATGSLSIICDLWTSRGALPGDPPRSVASPPLTTRDVAQRLQLTRGGTAGFAAAVERELREDGLFGGWPHDATLTREGEIARAELEVHVAEMLRVMRQRRSAWVDRHPREALMAAVVHVAAGQEPPPTLPKSLTEPRVDWGLVDSFTRYLTIDFDATGGDGGDGDGGDGGADGD